MPETRRMKTKVCLVGEAAVGKTSLVRRYMLDQFEDKYITTLGAKVSKKELELDNTERSIHVQMDMTIWEVRNSEGLGDSVELGVLHGTKGILAICDITAYSTLT